MRVQRHHAVTRDVRATVDERAAVALRAEPERFEPAQRDEAEAVVQLGDIDIRGP
jgi:hypothetical protein